MILSVAGVVARRATEVRGHEEVELVLEPHLLCTEEHVAYARKEGSHGSCLVDVVLAVRVEASLRVGRGDGDPCLEAAKDGLERRSQVDEARGVSLRRSEIGEAVGRKLVTEGVDARRGR